MRFFVIFKSALVDFGPILDSKRDPKNDTKSPSGPLGAPRGLQGSSWTLLGPFWTLRTSFLCHCSHLYHKILVKSTTNTFLETIYHNIQVISERKKIGDNPSHIRPQISKRICLDGPLRSVSWQLLASSNQLQPAPWFPLHPHLYSSKGCGGPAQPLQ